jgi:3-hydroxyacyl-CoA dehydrogenase
MPTTEEFGRQKVAVVGAGTIGLGWTVVFTTAGLETAIYDSSDSQLALLEKRLDSQLDLLSEAGRIRSEETEKIRNRASFCSTLSEAVQWSAYVQESVPEDLELKQEMFTTLDRECPRTTILASSASAHPMTKIAERVESPERCIIAHPTNPPHLVPLVEIVPGEKTDPAVVERTRSFLEWVGQSPIVCTKEVFGFVLNRLQFALFREALYLLREGVASPQDIDRCVHSGLGLRWAFLGPYGVEETNADNIEDDLRKFRHSINELMHDVCRPIDGINDNDIEAARDAISAMFPGVSHDSLVDFRNRMVLALRRLKERSPGP